MLTTILIILVALWLVGLVTANTLGGGLHLLLVAALVIFFIQFFNGRRVA